MGTLLATESNQIAFEKLGIGPFTIDRAAFTLNIGGDGFSVYWYGVLITAGILLAILFACRYTRRVGLTSENILDAALWGIPFGIIGARIYYIIFKLDAFRDTDGTLSLKQMLNFRNGGLAIYGGVIAAFIVAVVLCKVKKINLLNLLDVVSFGFLIGQGLGRWGNFFNCEAFGTETDLPWGMSINGGAAVHPTFLYESLWCFIGLAVLYIFARKKQKNFGEIFFLYLSWYGFERFFVEGLRTDSLYLFTEDTAKKFGFNIRVSQMLALILFIAGITCFILARKGIFAKVGVRKNKKVTASEEPSEDTEEIVEILEETVYEEEANASETENTETENTEKEISEEK